MSSTFSENVFYIFKNFSTVLLNGDHAVVFASERVATGVTLPNLSSRSVTLLSSSPPTPGAVSRRYGGDGQTLDDVTGSRLAHTR